MHTDSSVPVRDQNGRRNSFTEVSNVERRLWARIHSKGVLDTEVQRLYRNACSVHEKLFLQDNELLELQELEYSLWKLHYKHIDEFRKSISRSLDDKKNTIDKHVEGFKSFLSEATKFYQDLISKIKTFYGLHDKPFFYKNTSLTGGVEQIKFHKCQFVCHRLSICLGDLARYLELYGKPESQRKNWAVAATHYLEAAKMFPESGNPQNQLAVLATYVGDEFLALYHSVRSLAAEEPFPDALRNLISLFEGNSSEHIDSLESDKHFDFLRPSERIAIPSTLHEKDGSRGTDLWSLFVRMTSFFFVESSLDDFSPTFRSAMRGFESLLELDVAELSAALESYQHLNLSRTGPYRALHITTILIFIIHNLIQNPEQKSTNSTKKTQHPMRVQFALAVAFICSGRLVDRCLKGTPVIYFPLLPAVLVFIEWLVSVYNTVDMLGSEDDKCRRAMGYFFNSFSKLLNQLYEKGQINFLHSVALWEDYETRGFEPLSQNHLSLDFSTRWEDEINYKMKNDYRAYRIIQAAMKIVNRASDIKHKWILLYDEVSKKFCIKEAKESTDKKGKIVGVEEEEDIVFKPITRRNSEPLRTEDQVLVSDECLRRASSLLTAQNRPRVGSSPLGQHEPKGSVTVSGTLSEAPMSAGPPSLSSWVLNGERLVGESEKGGKFCKNVLDPIEDMDSDRFSALSLSSPRLSPPPHCAPMPSAPLLPDSAILFTGVSAGFSGLRAVENFAAPSMAGCYSNGLSIQGHHSTEPPIPSFIDHSQPFLGLMNPPRSRPLKGNQNLMWANNNAIFAPRNHNNLYGQEPSRSGPAPVPTRNLEWVPPLVYPSSLRLHAAYDQTGTLLRDYQRANPYVCGTVTGVRAEQRPR